MGLRVRNPEMRSVYILPKARLTAAKCRRTSDKNHRQYIDARLKVIQSRSYSLWVAPNHSESDSHCASSKSSGISKSCAHHIPHSGRMTGATEQESGWNGWRSGTFGPSGRTFGPSGPSGPAKQTVRGKLWGIAERALSLTENQYLVPNVSKCANMPGQSTRYAVLRWLWWPFDVVLCCDMLCVSVG